MSLDHLTGERIAAASAALRDAEIGDFGDGLIAFADTCVAVALDAVRAEPDIEESSFAAETADGMSPVYTPHQAIDLARESRALLMRTPELESDGSVAGVAQMNLYEIAREIIAKTIRENRPEMGDIPYESATPSAHEVVVGKSEDGFVYVSAELRERDPGPELSIMAHNRSSCGQARELLDDIEPAPGWTVEDLRRLREIWDRWHLNTMNAACVHLREVADRAGKPPHEMFTTESLCVRCGHKYGHGWLYEPIPADVLDWLRERFPTLETRR